MGKLDIRAENGGVYVDDTTATTGTFYAIICLADTVIASITQPDFTDASKLVGVTLDAGTVIYGQTTAFTLTSGFVQAVKY